MNYNIELMRQLARDRDRWDSWNYARCLVSFLYALKVLNESKDDHILYRVDYFEFLDRIRRG